MPKDEPAERPSRDERQRDKLAKKLISTIDKSYRTRQGKKIKKDIEKLQEDDPEIVAKILREAAKAKPPKTVQGKRIYSGKSRSFTKQFMEGFWEANPLPKKCSLCKLQILANGQHSDAPSIDHVRPWATIKTEIETVVVCKDGVHWQVVLAESMRAVFQDDKNLMPAHQGCNSGKSGPKDTDSIAPQRIGNCPGDDLCKELKGT